MKYKAVIFDLDGVIVSTDNYHYLAWKKLADEQGIDFNSDINERLRGVSRAESLEIILEKAQKKYTEFEKNQMAERKNEYYKQLIGSLSQKDLLNGVKQLLEFLKNSGIKIAIGSSSKNAKPILKYIGYENYFDTVIDGNDIKKSKPDGEVFIKAGNALGVESKYCLVIEDADAGVDAAINAQMDVLAVGSASANKKATYSMEDLSNLKRVKGILE